MIVAMQLQQKKFQKVHKLLLLPCPITHCGKPIKEWKLAVQRILAILTFNIGPQESMGNILRFPQFQQMSDRFLNNQTNFQGSTQIF